MYDEDNRGCDAHHTEETRKVWLLVIAALLVVVAVLGIVFAAVIKNTGDKGVTTTPQQEKAEGTTPLHELDYVVVEPEPVIPEVPVKTEIAPAEPAKVAPKVLPVETPTLSRYYEEGYDKGYDDGEDDAVMDNGFGGQYDDECRYKGKKRKEYQQGYDDGYEAGYYDNKAGDD